MAKAAKREMDPETIGEILVYQKNEITEYHIYSRLAKITKDGNNRAILEKIAHDEKRHHDYWKSLTDRDVEPSRGRILYYYWVTRLLGLTFGIKLMEAGEDRAKKNYSLVAKALPQAKKISAEEEAHEQKLLDMIEEERLEYAGSVVLGLNDALVELTGALAGLTFALQNSRLIALAGLITGISASFSMAASEYLSTRSSDEPAKALKSSLYTGAAYIITVTLLVAPYLLLKNLYLSLASTLGIALVIIFTFNFYISVAKSDSFKKRFFEMATISLGVAGISFLVGLVVRRVLGVDV